MSLKDSMEKLANEIAAGRAKRREATEARLAAEQDRIMETQEFLGHIRDRIDELRSEVQQGLRAARRPLRSLAATSGSTSATDTSDPLTRFQQRQKRART